MKEEEEEETEQYHRDEEDNMNDLGLRKFGGIAAELNKVTAG